MRKVLGLLLVMFFCVSCAKEDNLIPNVPVNYYITVQEFSIKATNGILMVPNLGVAGLVIYRTPENTYLAYDRCSTVNPEKKTPVIVDTGLTLIDPASGAKYSIYDGSPVKAPATSSLKKYTVIFTGSSSNGNLQVVN
jgi:nitrite reductase/ring-hydroxylating ferredoxin subunit